MDYALGVDGLAAASVSGVDQLSRKSGRAQTIENP